MGTIKVTVGNHFMANLKEEFICAKVDISDLEEMEYCADECCGQYLDMHGDFIQTNRADLDWDTIAEGCYYSIEEVE